MDEFSGLQNLRLLDLAHNQIREVGRLPIAIKYLNLYNNHVRFDNELAKRGIVFVKGEMHAYSKYSKMDFIAF